MDIEGGAKEVTQFIDAVQDGKIKMEITSKINKEESKKYSNRLNFSYKNNKNYIIIKFVQV